jgi:hypothetical protein
MHLATVYDPMEPDAMAVIADIPRLKLSDPVDHVLVHFQNIAAVPTVTSWVGNDGGVFGEASQ